MKHVMSFGFAIVESPEMKMIEIVQKGVFYLSSKFKMSRMIRKSFGCVTLEVSELFFNLGRTLT